MVRPIQAYAHTLYSFLGSLKFDEIKLLHLPTFNMVADILTKPLGPIDWRRLRRPLLGTAPIDTTPVVKLPATTQAG